MPEQVESELLQSSLLDCLEAFQSLLVLQKKKWNLLRSKNKKRSYLTQRRLGAEAAVNYKKTDNLTKSILDVAGPKGIDIILDCVGPEYFTTVK